VSVRIEPASDGVVVRLSGRDALMALARRLEVPASAIGDVRVVDDGLSLPLGLRLGGTGLPNLRYGRYRGHGRRTFAVLRRGQPAVVLETPGWRYDRVAVCVPDAAGAAASLRRAS
jgi:hypothetical protein